MLKAGKRMANKLQAQQLLTEIVKEEIIVHEKTVLAIKNLSELLLDELKTYGESEVLEEVKTLIGQLYEIGLAQHSYSVVIEGLILKSKFALLDGQLEKADKLLDQTILITEERGLTGHLKLVQKEKQLLQEQFIQWKDLIDSNTSLGARINQAQLIEYLKKAQRVLDM